MITRRALIAVASVLVSLVGLAAEPSGAAPDEARDAGPPGRRSSLVRTEAGWVQGVAGDDHVRFSGIPYAAPPVGERRWAPPAPATPWTGVRDASTPGPVCPQLTYGEDGASVAGDEDCLHLDVTAPRPHRSHGRAPRPVVVWLHGGGFTTGAAGYYDGARLAAGGDVIVVTVSYRLGALGFLSSPALDATGPESGNYGVQDQAAALAWVRRNVAGFGGDPGNVTVAGQSAGARSICAHLASPGSAGLFDRAIIQSGPCTDLVTKPAADQRGARVAADLGCPSSPSSAVVACLRDRPVGDLLGTLGDLGSDVTGEYSQQPWQPVAETARVPDQPLDALAAGAAADVPLLIGSNRDDIRPFVRRQFPTLSVAGYRTEIETLFGPDAPAVLARYPVDAYASPTVALATVLGDRGRWLGACTTLDTAEAAAAHRDVFAYEFREDSGMIDGGFPFGAFHNWELEFLFDTSVPNSQNPELTPLQQVLSATMIRQWSRFAATGDPGGRDLPDWPELGLTAGVIGIAAGDGGIAPTAFAEEHHCAFWSTVA